MDEYYAPDGTPLTAVEWAELFDLRKETVKQAESWWHKRTVTDNGSVSTVWLGLNYNWTDWGDPEFWETMIFGGEYDQYTWRYSSRADALDDHEDIVRALRSGDVPGS